MKEYLVEAIKEKDGAVVDSWEISTYSNMQEASLMGLPQSIQNCWDMITC